MVTFSLLSVAEVTKHKSPHRKLVLGFFIVWATICTAFSIWLFFRTIPWFTWAYSKSELQHALRICFEVGLGLLVASGFLLSSTNVRNQLRKLFNYQSGIAALAALGLSAVGFQVSNAGVPLYELVSQRPILFDDFRANLTAQQTSFFESKFVELTYFENSQIWLLSHDATYEKASQSERLVTVRKAFSNVWSDSGLDQNSVWAYARAIAIAAKDPQAGRLRRVTLLPQTSGRCSTPTDCVVRLSARETWSTSSQSLTESKQTNFQIHFTRVDNEWRFESRIGWHPQGEG
jgi:hypothetical protein